MITFRCDAYENISYFNDVAKSLLSLMGHSGTVPGALKAAEVCSMLYLKLQAGVGGKKIINQSFEQDNDDDNGSENRFGKKGDSVN